MATVEAVGRDIAAAADSNFDAPVAAAVKSLWAWAGFDQADNPDHAYAVTATADADGFTVSAVVTDRNVYVHPTQPDIPASADEVARSQTPADAEDPTLNVEKELADAGVSSEGIPGQEIEPPAAIAEPEPAPAPEPPAEDPAHAAAVDNAIVAVNVAADPATPADTRQAALDQARADADAALAQWPDSPQLQDLKTQLDQLAGDNGDPGPAA